MSFKYKAHVDVASSILSRTKTVGIGISTTSDPSSVSYADSNGHIQIPVPTLAKVDSYFTNLPLTQFGSLSVPVTPVSFAGYVFNTDAIIPAFMGGQYYELAKFTVNLTTIKANPANTTFYVYVKLQYGTPGYVVSTIELPETTNNVFIGTIITGASAITSTSIVNVSKFDNYRPSTTKQGAAFPVSTGNPWQDGSINW